MEQIIATINTNFDLFTWIVGVLGGIVSVLLSGLIYFVYRDLNISKQMFANLEKSNENNRLNILKNSNDIDKLVIIVKSNEKRDEKRFEIMERMLDKIGEFKPR